MSKTSSMRTPLGRVRGLGSAREGTAHFWRQRITGVAMVPLTVIFLFVILGLVGADRATAIATLGHPVIVVLALAYMIAGAIHMRLGMQVVIEDYVHEEKQKIALLILNTFFSAIVGLASVFALLKIGFGA